MKQEAKGNRRYRLADTAWNLGQWIGLYMAGVINGCVVGAYNQRWQRQIKESLSVGLVGCYDRESGFRDGPFTSITTTT